MSEDDEIDMEAEEAKWRKDIDRILDRMRDALFAGRGVRLSHRDLLDLNTTTIGQMMAEGERDIDFIDP